MDAAGKLLKESAPHMSAYADMLPTLLPIYAGESGKNTVTEASCHASIIVSSLRHASSLADENHLLDYYDAIPLHPACRRSFLKHGSGIDESNVDCQNKFCVVGIQEF